MKKSKKSILILFVCLIGAALLIGLLMPSDNTEYADVLMPITEQYSDDELVVFEDAFYSCVQDIKTAHPDIEKPIIVSTCLCTAKRVLRANINADNPAFQNDTYQASKDRCYRITVKHKS